MIYQKELDFLFRIFFSLNAVRNILLFFTINAIASWLLYASYVVIVLMIVLILGIRFKASTKVGMYFGVSSILLLILILIPMQYNPMAWNANAFTPVSFVLTIAFFSVTRKVCISVSTIRFCYMTFILQSIIAIACSFFPESFDSVNALTLNMGNSNQTAILLWSYFSFCFLFWARNKFNRKQSFALWLLMICLMIMIYLTQSRTALLSCILVILGYFWIFKMKKTVRVPQIVQYGVLVTPVVIPFAITELFKILPSGLLFFGKMLFSGREIIWKNIISAFFDEPLSHHLIEAPYYSAIMLNNIEKKKSWGCHNGILGVQWNYGLIVTVLVIVIFMIRFKNFKIIVEKNRNASMIFLIMLATIFYISFEEGMILGNICTTIFLPMLFVIGQSEQFYSTNMHYDKM